MKFGLFLVLVVMVIISGCAPTYSGSTEPDYAFLMTDGDSLVYKLVRGEVLVTRVLSAEGDTLELDNTMIDRIIWLRTKRDVTDQFINRDALKVELAKKSALERRNKLQAEVAAGKRRKSELDQIPFAILSADLERPRKGTPQIALTILNLAAKKISLLKTRIYCFDDRGRPVEGARVRTHVFDASSRVPIEPGEDFTTTLPLRSHPGTQRAKVEVHYLEYADHTWWKGKVEEEVK